MSTESESSGDRKSILVSKVFEIFPGVERAAKKLQDNDAISPIADSLGFVDYDFSITDLCFLGTILEWLCDGKATLTVSKEDIDKKIIDLEDSLKQFKDPEWFDKTAEEINEAEVETSKYVDFLKSL